MATDPKIRYDILANAEGEQDVARLAAELARLDDALDPAAAQRAQALSAELARLGGATAAVARFRELSGQTQAARLELERAQAAAQKMGAELAAAERPTAAQSGQMAKLRDAVRAAKAELQTKTQALQGARGALAQYGLASTQLAGGEAQLRQALAATRQEVAKLGAQGGAALQFQALATATDRARTELQASQTALQAFRAGLDASVEPTRQEQRELDRLTNSVRQAQVALLQQTLVQAKVGAALRASGVDTDRLLASQQRLSGAQAGVAAAAQQTAGAYARQATAATQSAATQNSANRSVRDGVKGIGDELGRLRNLSIAGILGGQTAQLLRGVTETADGFQNLAARVRIATGEGQAFETAMQGIFEVAQRTATSVESTANLFTRVSQAGRDMGLAQRDVLALTETINQAIAVSGASAAASDAALTQLIQGLQSGVLRGEEFNSVMEQAPRLARALADGLGVGTGELRKMAQQGQLTSDVVVRALQTQTRAVQAEFDKLPPTVGRAMTQLRNEWLRFVGDLDAGSGATAAVAAGIAKLADNLDTVGRVAGVAGSLLVAKLAVQGATALRTYAASAAAATGATTLLGASIAKIPSVINIAIAATGFEVGFQIGEMLRENSAIARRLGVAVVEFFQHSVNELRLLKEAAAAVFTDDTVGAAFERYEQRQQRIRDITADMMREAGEAPGKVAQAADQAATAVATLGDTTAAAAGQIALGGAQAAAGVGGIGSQAETAQQAIVALAEAAGVRLPRLGASAHEQAKALAEAAARGQDLADKIGIALPQALDKLAGSELAAFRASFVGALQQAGAEARVLDEVLRLTGERAARALGVDVARAGGVVSAEFEQAAQNVTVLIESMDALADAGVHAGNVLEQALRKIAEGARNDAELAQLRVRIEALGAAGRLSRPQVEALFQAIRARADEATGGINSLTEAYKLFGITSRDELRKTADGFRQAWERIRYDATLTLQQKQRAFVQYAQAAIAANGGVISSELKLQAETLKVELAADKAGQAVVRAAEDAGQAIDGAAKKTNEWGQEIDRLGRVINQVAQGFKNLGRGDPSVGAGGGGWKAEPNRAGSGQLVLPQRGAGWEFDATAWNLAAAQTATYGGGGTPDPNSGRFWRYTGAAQLGAPPAPPGAAYNGSAGWTPFGSASRTVNVNLNVGGQSYGMQAPERVADDFMRALELASRSSSGGWQ